MKKLIKALALALAITVFTGSIAFAEQMKFNSTLSNGQEVYLQTYEPEYDKREFSLLAAKLGKVVYDAYKQGLTKKEIVLKNVTKEELDSAAYFISDILPGEISTEVWYDKNKDNTFIVEMFDIGMTQPELYKNSDQLEKALNDLVAETNSISDIKEKLRYLNNRLVLECTYNYGASKSEASYNSAEEALLYKTARCMGFSDLVSELCHKLNIPVVKVEGTDHQTTYVYIDNKWKVWDLTWTVGAKNNFGKEIVYYSYTDEEGKITRVRGIAQEEYFLFDTNTEGYKKYLKDADIIPGLLGQAEFRMAIEYPELSPYNLSIDDILVKETNQDIKDNSNSTPNNTGTTTTKPAVKPSQPTIVIGGNGQIVTDNTTNKKLTANPTSSKVLINGKSVAFEAYTINGNNYFKLRDLAMALRNTNKKFEVAWDGKNNAISITANKPYTITGGELTVSKNPTSKSCELTTSKVYVNGKQVSFTIYTINGNNYFKLRDIGKSLNFGVAWDGKTNSIVIDTSKVYTE